MKITMKEIAISQIVWGYEDKQEEGVFGCDGLLNIRPPYQREFVYDNEKRNAVIHTIMRGFPLNVMYWAKNADDTYELLDGQQRTISFCQFVNGDFSIKYHNEDIYFNELTEAEKNQILDYKVMVYICEGSDKERLDWFRTINIAGEKLTEQELLNANYTGAWLADAKKKFSKTNCVAYLVAKDYVNGKAIRQEILETALAWISDGKENIASYMAEHQHDLNAYYLYSHFLSVIEWVKGTFPIYRKELKGLDWGRLYREYGENEYEAEDLEREINRLMSDEDVTNKKGVYEYVLSRGEKERLLSIRAFSDRDKRTAYERQKGICPNCGEHFDITEMQGDHIVEWSKGGKTTLDNLQMVCHKCHKDLTRSFVQNP